MKRRTVLKGGLVGAGAAAGGAACQRQVRPTSNDGSVRVQDIMDYVVQIKEQGLNKEERIYHGSAEAKVTGVTICWKATPDAMEDARERGDELIIGHESLFDPYLADWDDDFNPKWKKWLINRQRKQRLADYGMTFLRLHHSLDKLFIVRDFGYFLGLKETSGSDNDWNLTWEAERTQTLGEFIEHIKQRTGLKQLRMSDVQPMDYKIKKVGLLCGGGGLDSNIGAQVSLTEDEKVDVIVSGESDNYGFRYADEVGIPTIETSHETAEMPGIRRFRDVLAEAFPQLRVTFYENQVIWKIV